MWRFISLLGILILLPAISWCDTVQFAVNPADSGTLIQGPGSIDLFSSDLNGTVLSGQSLSLDLVLSDDMLARLFLSDPSAFGIGLAIHTNGGTIPGFAGPTTGMLLDPSGYQIGSAQVAGRAAGSDGTIDVGLVSFTFANLGGGQGADISGVHFDTSLPNNGFVITDAQLRFSLNNADDAIEFGTARQLPEPSTIGLSLIGALALALTAGRSHRK